MNSLIYRYLTAGVLAVWGSVLLAIFFTGRIGAYLHPTFRPFAMAAGFTLVVFAILMLFAPTTGASHGTGVRSTVRGVLTSLLLVGSLLLAFYNSSDSMDATAVANRNYVQDISQLPGPQLSGVAQSAPAEAVLPGEGGKSQEAKAAEADPYSLPKNKQGQVRAQLVDFLYAVQLPEMRSQLENKQVEVIGQLMPAKTNNPKGDRFVIIRMMMSCCAADAQPIALPLEPLEKPSLSEMTWVKVTGTASFPVVGGKRTPLIQNAALEKIPTPDEPYLY